MAWLARWVRTKPGLRALWLAMLRARNEAAERRPTEVEPGVFVGGVPTAARWAALRGAGVTHIVSLFAEAPPDAWLADADGVLWLPVPDGHPPSPGQLRAGCGFLDAARVGGRGVFIYCGSGMGRAPTMYLAWALRANPGDVSKGVVVVQRLRRLANPNSRQREALDRWVEAAS